MSLSKSNVGTQIIAYIFLKRAVSLLKGNLHIKTVNSLLLLPLGFFWNQFIDSCGFTVRER